MRLLLALLLCSSAFAQSTILLMGAGAPGAVATPTDSPGAGSYGSAQTVTLSDSTSGAAILYTTSGTAPSCPSTGTTYSAGFSVSTTTTVKAIGCKSGMTDSAVLTSVYTISAGITLVNVGSGHAANNSVGTPATSAAKNCTGSNFATVTVWAFNTSDPATDAPITDSVGTNTYVAVSPTASSAFSVLESTTFRSSGTFTPSSSMTFTATPTTNSLFAITAACWAGPTTGDSNSGTAVFGNGTTCPTGSTTASGTPSLFLSIITTNNAADAITPGGSFVLLDRIDAIGGTSVGGVTAWMTSSSAQSHTWADNAVSNVICATYSFK
jgi:hypothetical protein